MAKRDYYEVLGVARGIDEAGLKKAYRRLAMKHHPDRSKDDPDADRRFREIQEAYGVLSEPQKRALYDRFGHEAVGAAGAPGGAGPGFGGADFGPGFEDALGGIFGDLFGHGGPGRGGGGAERGADLSLGVELDLEEAVFGATREVRFEAPAVCGACDGKGHPPDLEPEPCAACGGAGEVLLRQGLFTVRQTCPKCRGRGRVVRVPCAECHGAGRVGRTRTLRVTIPPGVDRGDRVRLAGEGAAGARGGPPGHLYVEVRVRPHRLFRRDGGDLHCAVPISFATAALGGEVEVPTLDGHVRLTIPPETQSGRPFRLRGKGVRAVRGQAQGDMICTVEVETPVRLSARQRELLQELEESLRGDGVHSPQAHSWLKRGRHFVDNLKSWLH